MPQFNIDIEDDLKKQCKIAAVSADISLTKWILRAMKNELIRSGVVVSEVQESSVGSRTWTLPPPPPFKAEPLPEYNPFSPMSKSQIDRYVLEKVIGEYTAKLHPAFYMAGDEAIDPSRMETALVWEYESLPPSERYKLRTENDLRTLAFTQASKWRERLVLNPHMVTVPEKREHEFKVAVTIANIIQSEFEMRNQNGVEVPSVPVRSLDEIEAIVSKMPVRMPESYRKEMEIGNDEPSAEEYARRNRVLDDEIRRNEEEEMEKRRLKKQQREGEV